MHEKKPNKFYEKVLKQKVTEHKVQRAKTFEGSPGKDLPKKRVLQNIVDQAEDSQSNEKNSEAYPSLKVNVTKNVLMNRPILKPIAEQKKENSAPSTDSRLVEGERQQCESITLKKSGELYKPTINGDQSISTITEAQSNAEIPDSERSSGQKNNPSAGLF